MSEEENAKKQLFEIGDKRWVKKPTKTEQLEARIKELEEKLDKKEDNGEEAETEEAEEDPFKF